MKWRSKIERNADDLAYVYSTMFGYSWKITKKNRFQKIKLQCQNAGDKPRLTQKREAVYNSINQNQFLFGYFPFTVATRNVERLKGSYARLSGVC